ncbi:unnamed protein product, partial [marine sediment metagenome]
VHEPADPGRVFHAKGSHADDGHLKPGDHKDDQDVGKKETRNRYQEIGKKSG